MKKIFLSIVICILCLCLVGCKKDNKEKDDIQPVVGSWEENFDIEPLHIQEDILKVFNNASKKYDGMNFEALALLGMKSGGNYMFLCKGTTVTDPPTIGYKIVVVSRDSKDKGTIKSVKDFSIMEFVNQDIKEEKDTWNVNRGITKGVMPGEAEEAFKKATEKIKGVRYTPIILGANQLVSGNNYAILSLGKQTTKDAKYSLNVLTIYADLEGNAKVTSIANINLSNYEE